jgi:hypothetical protein
MNDQDHSLSLSDPDRSLVLSHLLVNFLKNLVSCQTSFRVEDVSQIIMLLHEGYSQREVIVRNGQ